MCSRTTPAGFGRCAWAQGVDWSDAGSRPGTPSRSSPAAGSQQHLRGRRRGHGRGHRRAATVDGADFGASPASRATPNRRFDGDAGSGDGRGRRPRGPRRRHSSAAITFAAGRRGHGRGHRRAADGRRRRLASLHRHPSDADRGSTGGHAGTVTINATEPRGPHRRRIGSSTFAAGRCGRRAGRGAGQLIGRGGPQVRLGDFTGIRATPTRTPPATRAR